MSPKLIIVDVRKVLSAALDCGFPSDGFQQVKDFIQMSYPLL